MNKNNHQTGERLTFYQIFSEKKYQVEIPIIQRDYAQGRASEQEIRDLFLDVLYSYLNENVKYRDLDFVYGSLSGDDKSDIKFIPLDGQQRLTTLFLLHWYLANKDGHTDGFRKVFLSKNASNFSYETRTSSSEFCNAIIANDIDFSSLLTIQSDTKNILSDTIKDSNWFFLSWESDPTIKAMLVMLDAIHNKFKGTTGFYLRLIDSDNPVITFHFLNLEEFKLTDDLYIKMNSRGKPLTPFENFKAKFEQYIDKITFPDSIHYQLKHGQLQKKVSVRDYFSNKIDTEWANFFWIYRDTKKNIYDDQIMNFIKTTAIAHYAGISSELVSFFPERSLIDRRNEAISFNQYLAYKCFDSQYIIDTIEVLDFIALEHEQINLRFSNYFYYDAEQFFKIAMGNGFDNFSQRIQFFAFCQYIAKWKTIEGLDKWIRVIHNLSEHTLYNRDEEFIRSIKSINKLLPVSNSILEHLIAKGQIDSFNSQQIIEERIKATLILKGDEWLALIYRSETNGYFNGQIEFLLKFSGILDYYIANSSCDWSTTDNEAFLEKFKIYLQKATSIFDDKGLKAFEAFSWERALLTKGDYLLREGSNYSFLIDNDRDISWKKLLRDENDGKRDLVKQLFDDSDFNLDNVQESLKFIIGKFSASDWRKHFIEVPETLTYLGSKKYIRWNSEDEIFLLSKERMSGIHAEYFTYALFVKALKPLSSQFSPFPYVVYSDVSGDDFNPAAILHGWQYKSANYLIRIIRNGRSYQLGFYDVNFKKIETEIIEIFEAHGFKLNDLGNRFSLQIKEVSIVEKLRELCSTLRDTAI